MESVSESVGDGARLPAVGTMKITIDRIEAHPPHAFSPGELRAFLRALPGELLDGVEIVRLSNATKSPQPRRIAAFSRLEGRLVVESRGISRESAMRAVIRCLVRSNSVRDGGRGRGPVPLPDAEIEILTDRWFETILPRMPEPPHWNRMELRYARGTFNQLPNAGDAPSPDGPSV